MTTTLTSDSTVVAGKPKENAKTKASGRSGKEKESSKSKAPAKAKLATEVVKKPFKVVVRKLPVRDFNAEDFAKSITRVLSQLGYGTSAPGDETAKDADKEFIRIEHFIEGKLSRKRGPVSGAGFLCIKDEEVFHKFISNCPSQFPFLKDDEINNQPDIEMASNQRVLRAVEKIDKLENTYEEDQDYKNFLIKEALPEVKRPSAETQYDNKVEAPAIDYKNIPMIKFLREKGEKKIAEKRSLRRSQAAGVLLNVAGKGKGGPGKGDRGSSGGSKGTGGTAGSGSGSASSSVKRTTLASSASTNPKTQSSRSDQSSNGGGGGGGAGRGSSKGGGKGSEGIVPKPPTPAVGAPVDADLQEAMRRSINTFREESAAAAAASSPGTQGEKGKMSRREKERERFKKKAAVATSEPAAGTLESSIPAQEAKGERAVKEGGGNGGGGGGGGKGGGNRGKRGSKESSNQSTGGGDQGQGQGQKGVSGDGKEDTKGKRGGGKGDKGGGAASDAPKPAPIKIMKRADNVPTQTPSA